MKIRYPKYLKFNLALIIGVFLLLGIQAQPTAQPMDNPDQDQQQSRALLDKEDKEKPKYVPGQFLIKFKSEEPHAVNEDTEYILESKGKFKDAVSDKSDSLDNLMKKHNVKRAKSVFVERYGLTTRDAREKQDRMREISKARHQSRSQRAPKDATFPDLSNIYVLEVPPESDIEAIVHEFQADPHVEYAQPDYIIEFDYVPDDPYYNSYGSWGQNYDDLWGLKKIQAGTAWDINQGDNVIVAVVDSGLDYNHPDIANNVWVNPCEDLNGNGLVDLSDFNGVDDACTGEPPNGFVDDVRGWDFYDNDNAPMDGFGHGTHVAGTIAAVGNNGIGIIGVAPHAKIMPLKASSNSGSFASTTPLVRGIVYAAEQGASVINNSWKCGSWQCASAPVEEDAVRTAHSLGSVVVFAAGNDDKNVFYVSPQNMRETITVSATDQNDEKALFPTNLNLTAKDSASNYGIAIDVAAPGRNIISLWPGNGYIRASGTSMAAPHVAGLAALILSQHPDFNFEDVRQALRTSSDDIDIPGFDFISGYGRVNASRALQVNLPLKVRIDAPNWATRMNPFDGSVEIIGTVEGTNLAQYQLFYSLLEDPVSWVSTGTPGATPVVNGILGYWDVAYLDSGQYLLRVLATTSDGGEFEDIIPTFIERPGASTQEITNDPSGQQYPSIFENKIVWQDERNGATDIYLYDINTGLERRITTNTSSQISPDISGDWIVWQDRRNISWNVYLYNITTATEQRITTDPANHFRPRISGDKIVWMDDRNGNYDIYLYDIATGREQQITTDVSDQKFPDISGNRIVWEDHRNGGMDVYLYDIDTAHEQRITTVSVNFEARPSISDDKIVWYSQNNVSRNIYFYDISTAQQQNIVANAGSLSYPAISGNEIVWAEYRYGSMDVFLYNLSDGKEYQITWNFKDQKSPAISEGTIVWEDTSNGNYDIYSYYILLHCGNGQSDPEETYQTCPFDITQPSCGNYTCESTEHYGTCQFDCPIVTCGNGMSDPEETYQTCPFDITQPSCGNYTCESAEHYGTCQFDCTIPTCGNGQSDPEETYQTCPFDITQPSCGNYTCESAEHYGTCQFDCTIPTCGNGMSDPEETYQTCPFDITQPSCGNYTCESTEHYGTCQFDCPIVTCGNGQSDPEETYQTCPFDITQPSCGNYTCESAEHYGTCQFDCPIVTCGNGMSDPEETYGTCPFDISQQSCGDYTCGVYENYGTCQFDCTIATCGNGMSDPEETYGTCPFDISQQSCGDYTCGVYEHYGTCQFDCPIVTCGNGQSDPEETYQTCPFDITQPSCGNYTCDAGENSGTCVFDCPIAPDLIMSALSTTATAVTRGSSFSLSNTARNQGTASAGSFKIAFSLSTDAVYGGTGDIAFSATRSVTSLAVGASSSASTSLTVPTTTPLGNYYVCAKADSGNTVTETDEANNGRCTTSTIQIALPDLVMTQIGGPANAATGTSVSITNTVKNQGVSSAGSFYVGLYLSTDATITTADTRISRRYLSSLAAGFSNSATTTVTVPTTLAAGTYYIGAIADYSNTRAETSETNNALVGNTIVLTPGADLVMTAVSGPTSGTKGTSIGISNTVKNQGVGGVASFAIGLYLSTDANITTTDLRIGTRSVGSLAAGATSSATTSVTIPATLAVGTYYIGAIADYANARVETNETNNARAGNTINIQ